jgi:hypothetical protein
MATEITQAVVVLVEGKDEYYFLPEIAAARALPNVQFLEYGGKPQLASYLRTLPLVPGFGLVTGIGVIRDADSNHLAALQSVRDALRSANLPVPSDELVAHAGPPRTAFFLAPGKGRQGALEDCLIASVGGHPALPCIESLIACVETATQVALSKKSKAKVWSFLATQPEPLHHISEGARAGVWPMTHAAFDDFEKLIRLVSGP